MDIKGDLSSGIEVSGGAYFFAHPSLSPSRFDRAYAFEEGHTYFFGDDKGDGCSSSHYNRRVSG